MNTMKQIKTMAFMMLIVIFGFVLVGCNSELGKGENLKNAYITIDINPSIEIITDDQGLVTQVNGLNEDAQVLLVDTDFTGKTVDETIDAIVKLAAEMGYIGYDTENAIIVTAQNDSDSDELENEISDHLKRFFRRNGYRMAIYLARHQATSEEKAKAEELGITVGKLRLIEMVMKFDETLTYETAKDMPVRELNQILKSARKEMRDLISDELRSEYEQLRESLRTAFYAERAELLLNVMKESDETVFASVLEGSSATVQNVIDLYTQYVNELKALKETSESESSEENPVDLEGLRNQIEDLEDEIVELFEQFRVLDETAENYTTLKEELQGKIAELRTLKENYRKQMMEKMFDSHHRFMGFDFGFRKGSFYFAYTNPNAEEIRAVYEKYEELFAEINVSLAKLEETFVAAIRDEEAAKLSDIQDQLASFRTEAEDRIASCRDQYRQQREMLQNIWRRHLQG